MSLYLPPELRWVALIAGAEWPDGDEDKMFAMGDEWLDAAKAIQALLPQIQDIRSELRAAYASGAGGDQAVSEVGKLISGNGSLGQLADYYNQIGQSTRNAGTTMEQTKLMVIISLTLLANEITLAWLFPPTAPGVEAAAVGATRLLLWRMIRAVEAFLESIPGVGSLVGKFIKFIKIVPDLPGKTGDMIASPISLAVRKITPNKTLLDLMPESMTRNAFVRDVLDVMPDEFAKWLVKSAVNVGLWSGGQDVLVQTIQIAEGHRDGFNGRELGLSMGSSMVGKWTSHLPAVYLEKWGGDLFKYFGVDPTHKWAGMVNGAVAGAATNVISGLAGAGLYSLVTHTSYYSNIKTAQIGAVITGAGVGAQRGYIGQLGAKPTAEPEFTAAAAAGFPEVTWRPESPEKSGGADPLQGITRSGTHDSLLFNIFRPRTNTGLGPSTHADTDGQSDTVTPTQRAAGGSGNNQDDTVTPIQRTGGSGPSFFGPSRTNSGQDDGITPVRRSQTGPGSSRFSLRQSMAGTEDSRVLRLGNTTGNRGTNRRQGGDTGTETGSRQPRAGRSGDAETDNAAGVRANRQGQEAKSFKQQQKDLQELHDKNYVTARKLDHEGQNFFVRQFNSNIKPWGSRAPENSTHRNAELARHRAEMDALNFQERAEITHRQAQDATNRATVARNNARDAERNAVDAQRRAEQAEANGDPNAATLRQQATQARTQANSARLQAGNLGVQLSQANGRALWARQRFSEAQDRMNQVNTNQHIQDALQDISDAQQTRRPAQTTTGDESDAGSEHEGPEHEPEDRNPYQQRRGAENQVEQARQQLGNALDQRELANNEVEQRLAPLQDQLDTLLQARGPARTLVREARDARTDADQEAANRKRAYKDATDENRAERKAALRQAQRAAIAADHRVQAAEGDLRYIDRDISKIHDQLKSTASKVLSGSPDAILKALPSQAKDGPLQIQQKAHNAVQDAKKNLDEALQNQRKVYGQPESSSPTAPQSRSTLAQHERNVDDARQLLRQDEPADVSQARIGVQTYRRALDAVNAPEPDSVTRARNTLDNYNNARQFIQRGEPDNVAEARANVRAYDNAQDTLHTEPANVTNARDTLDNYNNARQFIQRGEPDNVAEARANVRAYDNAQGTLHAPEPGDVIAAHAALQHNPADTQARDTVDLHENIKVAAQYVAGQHADTIGADRATVDAHDQAMANARNTVRSLTDDQVRDLNNTVTEYHNALALAQYTVYQHADAIGADRATVDAHDQAMANARNTVRNLTDDQVRDLNNTVTEHRNTRAAAQDTVNQHADTIGADRATLDAHNAARATALDTVEQHGADVDNARLQVRMLQQEADFDQVLARSGLANAQARAELTAFDRSVRFVRILEDGTFMSGRVRARKIKLSELMPDRFTALTAPNSDFWADPVNTTPRGDADRDRGGNESSDRRSPPERRQRE